MKSKKAFRQLVIFLGVALVAFGVSQSRAWFFATTGQHKVDFVTATGEFDNKNTLAVFEGKEIAVPELLAGRDKAEVLGGSAGEKRIEVDITNQRLYAFEGGSKVFDFVISTGKPWWATPTGEFRPWIKLRYTRMRGGSKALGTYYDLPNVPFVMFYSNSAVPGWRGYAIHGTYWHNNFGHPMSHGCVNLKIPDAESLYYWSEVAGEGRAGTRIVIYGQTPAG